MTAKNAGAAGTVDAALAGVGVPGRALLTTEDSLRLRTKDSILPFGAPNHSQALLLQLTGDRRVFFLRSSEIVASATMAAIRRGGRSGALAS